MGSHCTASLLSSSLVQGAASGLTFEASQCHLTSRSTRTPRRRRYTPSARRRLTWFVRRRYRSARAGYGSRNPHRQLPLRRYHVRDSIAVSSVCALSLSSLPQGHRHGSRHKLVRCARPISMDFRSRSPCTVRSSFSTKFRYHVLSKLWLAASSSHAQRTRDGCSGWFARCSADAVASSSYLLEFACTMGMFVRRHTPILRVS
jgi:hypothetical protein